MASWRVVLTSAAVGALVSAVIGLVGQHLDRRARQRELAFKSAMDAAYKRIAAALDLMVRNNAREIHLPDAPAFMATYYRWFYELIQTGRVPAEMAKQEREFAELETRLYGENDAKPCTR